MKPRMKKTTIVIEQQTYDRMLRLLPWGTQSKLIDLMLKDLLDIVEQEPLAIGVLLSKAARPREVIKPLKETENEIKQLKEVNNKDG